MMRTPIRRGFQSFDRLALDAFGNLLIAETHTGGGSVADDAIVRFSPVTGTVSTVWQRGYSVNDLAMESPDSLIILDRGQTDGGFLYPRWQGGRFAPGDVRHADPVADRGGEACSRPAFAQRACGGCV